jgi:diguanylate cyclase
MDYPHSEEQASEYAGLAVATMRERGIPANPNNFTVWYNYHSGAHHDLNRTLDILLDNNEQFTPARNAAVYRRFCASPYEALPLHLIAERMEAELGAVLTAMETAGKHADAYHRSLEGAAGELGEHPVSDKLKQVIGRILTQTRAMAQQSREVEKQLNQSWSEVGQLKEDLECARREAMTDSLTGLANRKMFDIVLRQEAMLAMEQGEELSMLFVDIDHFKKFNDSHGHHVGDQVLRLLAASLKESLKGQDTPARYGGEEFAVLLPRTKLASATLLADNIRLRVAGKTVINRKSGERLGQVTVSIGVATFKFGEALRQFVERADKALYTAKRRGRNRVVNEEQFSKQEMVFGS